MRIVFALCLAFALVSCSSVPREGWSMGGPSLEKGAEFRLSTAPDGAGLVSIVSPYFGDGVELLGNVVTSDGTALPASLARPDAALSYEIELTELRYFGNWPRGWTEAVFQASGLLRLSFEDGRWTGRVFEAPGIGEVKTAKLRYMDSFLSGDQAVQAVRHRLERIKAAVAVWREGDDTWFERPIRKSHLFRRERGQSFAEAVGPVFFPEVYGYADGSWSEGPWVRGDGRKWDTAYTKSRFPEQLWNVRDSGTLHRDWEEGFPLWYLIAQWSPFWDRKFPVGVLSRMDTDGDSK